MASVSYHKVINWHLSAVLAVIIFIVINYQILLGEENVDDNWLMSRNL
jgi:hypothetical protein